MHQNKLIVVLGPTASGKSDLAVSLAKKFNGEIISADSRQVYKGMDLGTGKVPRDKKIPNLKTYRYNSMELYHHSKHNELFHNSMELGNGYFYKRVQHHLLDVASPKRVFTVEEYKQKASKVIGDIWKRGKLPILCGGTGFYIDTVVYGTEFPRVPPNTLLRKVMEKKTTETLFTELQKFDPERAGSIDSKNRHRVMRSLEIAKTLGKVPKVKTNPLSENILYIGVMKESVELKKLIFIRLKKRIRQGMLQEIESLHASGVSWKRLESFGLEYRWGAKLLKNEISKEEFFNGLARDIFRYAKRQMTWFKRNKDICWVKNEKEALKLAEDF